MYFIREHSFILVNYEIKFANATLQNVQIPRILNLYELCSRKRGSNK